MPPDAATKAGLDTRVNVWEDNWDDDTKEDDFAEKLRWAGTGFEPSGSETGLLTGLKHLWFRGMEGGRGVTRRRGEEATPPPAKKRC